MGVTDTLAAGAIDVYADELLREAYPDQTADMLTALLASRMGNEPPDFDLAVNGPYE
jgi:hypothetical protein